MNLIISFEKFKFTLKKTNLNTDNLISCIVKGIEEVKGSKINILDLKNIENAACKFFIVCSGNSNTQVNAITNSIKKTVSKEIGEKPYQIEGLEISKWVLIDYVDVVVHIFVEKTRNYYNIEELWEEAHSTLVENKN